METPREKECCVDCRRDAEGVGYGYSAGCYDKTCSCHSPTHQETWEVLSKTQYDALAEFISHERELAKAEERMKISVAIQMTFYDGKPGHGIRTQAVNGSRIATMDDLRSLLTQQPK